jgi:peptide/nickel transport system permease protein
MYGGRTSLLIGFGAALLTTALAVLLALFAGYYRGWVDAVISRALDVLWAIPVMLLGIALGVALAVGGLEIGPIEIEGGSLLIPTLVIGVAFTTYMARPLRGEVLALREKEFVEAAVAQGAGPLRVMFRELLPNLWSTILVFFTLNVANALLFESGLSFLGAGVQPPESSWGSMIAKGNELLYSAPQLTIAPGVMIFLTVLSLNVFGDCLRDALDPKSKIGVEAHAGVYEPEAETA